jgi:EAL domain-containing protein (putative c-di-GMP-specific phosphodiesterase class I)
MLLRQFANDEKQHDRDHEHGETRHQAIADGVLEVYYQPCVSLQDNKITGCEARCAGTIPNAA